MYSDRHVVVEDMHVRSILSYRKCLLLVRVMNFESVRVTMTFALHGSELHITARRLRHALLASETDEQNPSRPGSGLYRLHTIPKISFAGISDKSTT